MGIVLLSKYRLEFWENPYYYIPLSLSMCIALNESFIRTCAYQGVRNVSFSGNFAYLLNGWPQIGFEGDM